MPSNQLKEIDEKKSRKANKIEALQLFRFKL